MSSQAAAKKSRRSLGKTSSTQPVGETLNTSASTSSHQHHSQPAALAEYRERKKAEKADRIERGKKLAEKLKKGIIRTHKPQTKSQKAGLVLPVHKILKEMKRVNPNRVVQENAAVMATGVVEYLCAELLELAGNCTRDFGVKRITPRHLFLAIKNDPEIDHLLKDATLMQGGAVPNIHPSLLKTLPDKKRHIVDTVDMSKNEDSPSKRSRN